MPLMAMLVISMFGCMKDEETSHEKQYNADDALVKQYIEENGIDAERDATGFYYSPIKLNPSGQLIQQKDIFYFKYKMSLLNGNVLEDKSQPSDSIQKAMHNNVAQLYGFSRSFSPQGLDLGLAYMREGEKYLFVIPSYMAYYSASVDGFLPAYSNLAVEMEILNIVSAEEQKLIENDTIDAYIERASLEDVVEETASGLHYVTTAEGTGDTPANGKVVTVHYTGKLLDGTVFDSSINKKPLSFVIGQNNVIEGWEEGIALMKEGEKAQLIIPSHLAYYQSALELPQSVSNVEIPPFSVLIFDVELVDIQ